MAISTNQQTDTLTPMSGRMTVGGELSTEKVCIREGANASMGIVTLGQGGTVTVFTTRVTASSRIFHSRQSSNGPAGHLEVSARTPGVSFTLSSSLPADRSVIAWHILEPS